MAGPGKTVPVPSVVGATVEEARHLFDVCTQMMDTVSGV